MVSETGDSFPAGAISIVEPEMDLWPGGYVTALGAPNEAGLKQLIKDKGDLYLKPLTNRLPVRPLGNAKSNWRLAGVHQTVQMS